MNSFISSTFFSEFFRAVIYKSYSVNRKIASFFHFGIIYFIFVPNCFG